MKTKIKVVSVSNFRFGHNEVYTGESLFSIDPGSESHNAESCRRFKFWRRTDPRVKYMTRDELRMSYPRTANNTLLWLDREKREYDEIGIHEDGGGTPFHITNVFFLVNE